MNDFRLSTDFFTYFLVLLGAMDWAFVHKTWDKWASANIGFSGHQQHSPFNIIIIYLFIYKFFTLLSFFLSLHFLGHPLKAALLINYDPTGPSRLLSTM